MTNKKLDQKAYEHVVKLIQNGQLLEREHITEQMIADSLDISRTPVRKAFDRLVCDNYLENIENVGVRVKKQELDAKGITDRVDYVERLINHYLFDLEKNEKQLQSDVLGKHLNEMADSIHLEDDAFEYSEMDYWYILVSANDNLYMIESILKAIRTVLFDDGPWLTIQHQSREMKQSHFSELTNHLVEMDYPNARREIRILFNKLKLNVIEHGMTI